MTDLNKINFWKRLETFINNVQVNDAMSEEEKDVILLIAKEQGNSNKEGVSDNTKGKDMSIGVRKWCDTCGMMTNWIDGECENYKRA